MHNKNHTFERGIIKVNYAVYCPSYKQCFGMFKNSHAVIVATSRVSGVAAAVNTWMKFK